jgi:hypothetical protein
VYSIREVLAFGVSPETLGFSGEETTKLQLSDKAAAGMAPFITGLKLGDPQSTLTGAPERRTVTPVAQTGGEPVPETKAGGATLALPRTETPRSYAQAAALPVPITQSSGSSKQEAADAAEVERLLSNTVMPQLPAKGVVRVDLPPAHSYADRKKKDYSVALIKVAEAAFTVEGIEPSGRVFLDSGAQPSMLGQRLAKRLGLLSKDLEVCPYRLVTSSGQKLQVKQTKGTVKVAWGTGRDRVEVNHRFLISDAKDYDVLLGVGFMGVTGLTSDPWTERGFYRPGFASDHPRVASIPLAFAEKNKHKCHHVTLVGSAWGLTTEIAASGLAITQEPTAVHTEEAWAAKSWRPRHTVTHAKHAREHIVRCSVAGLASS